jgi:UDP-glucose 4-epimerase
MIHAFEKVIGLPILRKIVHRGQGDVTISFADASKAYKELYWLTQKGIYEMCQDKEMASK